MCILFYFDHQINPERGGTERVSDILAHAFKVRGERVFYMARYKEYPVGDIQTFFLPEQDKVVSAANIAFIERVVDEYEIDYIINQGTNGNDVYLFNHAVLHIQAKIISCLHFSVYEGLNFFRELLSLEFNIKQPVQFAVDCMKWLKMPYNKRQALANKKERFQFIYQKSDAVVVLSSKYMRDFAEIAQISEPTKLYSITNPVAYSSLENKIGKKENEIVFVGRLSFAEKRVDRILNIWKHLHANYPKWSLSIVGDGPDRTRLERWAKRLQLTNIKFQGFQSPEEYYERAKLFCMTSTHEGLPMVLIEAMQYGVVPVVYNSFGAAEDMIQNHVNGVLVPPFNEEEYTKVLEQLMNDDAYRTKLSGAAVRSVERYSLVNVMKEWNNLFERLKYD